MTHADCHRLLASHLRLHADLLALWRHTALLAQRFPSGDWHSALRGRAPLLERLHSLDAPRLAADTGRALRDIPHDDARASLLRALQGREMAMMENLLALDKLVQAALAAHLQGVVDRLRRARQARSARDCYRWPARRAPRLDHRG